LNGRMRSNLTGQASIFAVALNEGSWAIAQLHGLVVVSPTRYDVFSQHMNGSNSTIGCSVANESEQAE
jgi:hypothetical protein